MGFIDIWLLRQFFERGLNGVANEKPADLPWMITLPGPENLHTADSDVA